MLYEGDPAKRSRSRIDGAASAALLFILEGISHHQNSDLSGGWPSVLSISLSVLLLFVFLCVPRGSDESYNGSPVDRQNTASIIELLTFLWPRKVFRLDNLEKKDVGALPVLPASLRTATLAERHRQFASQLASHRLGFVLLRAYLGPLIFQSILAILNSLAVLGPNLVTYRLLQHLSGEREGDSRDTLFLVVLLGVSNLLPVLLTAWMKWIGSSMISIPMRYTLAALTYQKVLSLPTIAVSPEDKEAKSMATLLHMNALRFDSDFPGIYPNSSNIGIQCSGMLRIPTLLQGRRALDTTHLHNRRPRRPRRMEVSCCCHRCCAVHNASQHSTYETMDCSASANLEAEEQPKCGSAGRTPCYSPDKTFRRRAFLEAENLQNQRNGGPKIH